MLANAKKVLRQYNRFTGSYFLGHSISFVLLLLLILHTSFIPPSYKLARLKYNGGGDWYGDRTALINLARFCNENIGTSFYPEEAIVEPGSGELFNYPFVFVTGHGNIIFSQQEATNLRNYLIGGGFLHICDNYGFDKFIRLEMKKVFPELDFIELPPSHTIFQQKYKFQNGLPKVHEHDGKRPQAFALIYQGRIVCFYDYEADLGNGWEDVGVYPGDSQEIHQKALQMGANLVQYALNN
ncbi:DUF4159 domain-containing protein [Solitalea lacus]|uniref:DUF4159 domain-containing protein n=1 Tax=Solitalea lacus TaxID=2911172 RepID=UPI001EDA3CE5|nr:DUF4159 domain-containing protein [Solitalea lacus]UKJ07703.1 DUF4159 domain-containing protein [Solitalea lacus]